VYIYNTHTYTHTHIHTYIFSGDKYGPICDQCGQGGTCNWNFGTCPIDEEELLRREQMLNMTQQKLDQATSE
jgi:hypothetical protein